MKSKTKSLLSDEIIEKCFVKAGFNKISNIAPLGAGMYNSVYSVTADGKDYAIKIAPPDDVEVMSYEKEMMAVEVFWYKQMKENTCIQVPEVFFYDTSKEIIPSEYFIMEKIDGAQIDKIALSKEEKTGLNAEMAKIAAEIHKIKNDKFGYIQMGLHDNWYLAIRASVQALIEDAAAKGKKTKRGEKLLAYIDKYKDILEKVECCMVNYDIWAPNILANRENGKLKYWLIDPERGFWGDRIGDFVCLDIMNPLSKKDKAIAAYNSVSDEKIVPTRELEIRYAILMAQMGLIQEVEKYYRYTPAMIGWWTDVFGSNFLFYKIAFSLLK